MKIAVVADIHMRAKRLEEIKKAWEQALNSMVSEGVNILLIAGDIFHFHNIFDFVSKGATTGTILAAFKEPLLKSRITTVIVEGTHDRAEGNQLGALTALQDIESLLVSTKPEFYQWHGVTVATLPWGYGTEVLPQLREGFSNQKGLKIVVGHCSVREGCVSEEYRLPGEQCQFGVEDLASIGADLVLLGHYHKRQILGDYPNIRYVGALLQQSYGDEGNPHGFEIIDYDPETRSLQERYIEIDTPKYKTVAQDNYKVLEFNDQDFVRVVGTNPDAITLPDRHTFMLEVEKTKFQPRVELTPHQDIVELLQIWLRQNGQEARYERLKELLLSLEGLQSGRDTGFGSLEQIDRVCVENIARHRKTEIAIPAGMTAIIGPNGCGKTTFLESIMAALYGELVTYKNSLYDYITPQSTKARLELDFQAGGKQYRATRQLSVKTKTPKQTGNLTELDSGTALAGPKITGYDQAIIALVGSKDTLVKSVFNSQRLTGDLMDADPAERKTYFYNLLGIDWMVKQSKDVTDKAKDHQEQVRELTTKKKSEEERIEVITSWINSWQGSVGNLIKVQEKQKELSRQKDELLGKVAEKRAEIAYLESDVKKRSKLSAEKDAISERVAHLKKMIKELSLLAQQTSQIKSEIQALADLKGEWEKHQQTLLANSTIEKGIGEHQLASSKITNQISKIGDEYKAKKDEVEKKIRQLEWNLEGQRGTLKKEIDNLTHKAGMVEEAGCKKNPIPCVFINDAVESKQHLGKANRDLSEVEMLLKEQLFAMEERAEIENMEVEYLIDERLQEFQNQIKLHKSAIAEAKSKILPLESVDLVKVKKRLEALPELEEKLSRSEHATEKAQEYASMLTEKESELKAKEEELSSLLTKEKEKKDLEQQVINCMHNKSIVDGDLSILEADIKRLEALVANLYAKREEITEISAKAEAYNSEIEMKKAVVEDYETLATALGKNGIPQLIIENSFPQLQETCRNLIAQINGGFSLSLSTQRLLDNDSYKETVDILVSDDLGTRDIRDHSGGEQRMARTVFRMALAFFQKQEAGKNYTCLLADELFDELDEENMGRMVDLLTYLKGKFRQVIVVTHNMGLVYARPGVFDRIIRFDMQNGMTVVEDK